MNKNFAVLLLISAFISGCTSSATTATSNTLPIKLINEKFASTPSNNCDLIGTTIGNHYSVFQSTASNIKDAQLKAAKEALSSGANTAIIKDTQVTDNGGHNVIITLETYNCELQ